MATYYETLDFLYQLEVERMDLKLERVAEALRLCDEALENRQRNYEEVRRDLEATRGCRARFGSLSDCHAALHFAFQKLQHR